MQNYCMGIFRIISHADEKKEKIEQPIKLRHVNLNCMGIFTWVINLLHGNSFTWATEADLHG